MMGSVYHQLCQVSVKSKVINRLNAGKLVLEHTCRVMCGVCGFEGVDA